MGRRIWRPFVFPEHSQPRPRLPAGRPNPAEVRSFDLVEFDPPAVRQIDSARHHAAAKFLLGHFQGKYLVHGSCRDVARCLRRTGPSPPRLPPDSLNAEGDRRRFETRSEPNPGTPRGLDHSGAKISPITYRRFRNELVSPARPAHCRVALRPP